MESHDRWGWLALLGPVLVCLPCLAVPLLAVGGAAALSGVSGVVTGNAWLAVLILLAGHGLAGVLLARRWQRRRKAAACCPPTSQPTDPTPAATTEVSR